jgi:hypothetical protein
MLQAHKFSRVTPAAGSKSFPLISKSGVRFTPKRVTPIVETQPPSV